MDKLDHYRELGIKLTPQRLAILRCLEGNRDHPSAEDIYTKVRRKFPTMSLSTVYNTLELLREKGEIAALSIDPDRYRYDPETVPHHHMICRKCRKILDVNADFVVQLPEELRMGFQVSGSHIEFYGTCLECSEKEVV